MDKMIHKISRILAILLMVVGAIYIIIVWSKGETAIKENPGVQSSILNPFFYDTYIAFFICLAAALIFPVIFMVSNPKNAIRALVGIGLLLIVAGISYGIADSSNTGEIFEKYQITTAQSKNVGTGLYLTYILGFLTVATLVYFEVVKLFK
ncbi:MAG: hypothetical protein KKA07_06015 [Bacteroidetes bacterium]|nr:hypothetical protein [Bacteroidota bacterium]MBU1718610.1 hypothetical protein [Bacteroidota bacterium]